MRSVVPAVLARYFRRRNCNLRRNVGCEGGEGEGIASGCGVGWLAAVEAGIVVVFGCGSAILRI